MTVASPRDARPQLRGAIGVLREEAWQLEAREAGALRQWAEVPFVPDDSRSPKPHRYRALRIVKGQGSLFADGSDRKHFAIVGETLLRLACALRRRLFDAVRRAFPPPPRSTGGQGPWPGSPAPCYLGEADGSRRPSGPGKGAPAAITRRGRVSARQFINRQQRGA